MSEDPGRDGANWFIYAADESTNGADWSGREFSLAGTLQSMTLGALLNASISIVFQLLYDHQVSLRAVLIAAFIGAVAGGLAANVGALYSGTLGSFLLGASLRQFAALMFLAIGIGAAAGAAGALFALVLQNFRIALLLDSDEEVLA